MGKETNRLIDVFAEHFGGSEGVSLAVAPGRVNIIGEHTDYNGGPVMPLALDMCVEIVFRKRDDGKVILYSEPLDETTEFSLDALASMKKQGWGAYPAGVCCMLREKGIEPCGMEGVVGGGLTIGIGLASSAALEVAAAAAQLRLASGKIEKEEVALLCQKAEHEFAGVNCGIMDQFASVIGSREGPLFIDCRTLAYKELPLQRDVAVVICDTHVKHSLASSEYNKRRAECEEAFSILSKHLKGLSYLAQIPLGEFKLLKRYLSRNVGKRAEHVVTETMRTNEAAKAFAASNPLQAGVLMNASHVSLRDMFEVSCPELDTLAEAAWDVDGVYGSRMTGGGFGGCTVTLVARNRVEQLEQSLRTVYKEKFNRELDVYVCRPHQGSYTKDLSDK